MHNQFLSLSSQHLCAICRLGALPWHVYEQSLIGGIFYSLLVVVAVIVLVVVVVVVKDVVEVLLEVVVEVVDVIIRCSHLSPSHPS